MKSLANIFIMKCLFLHLTHYTLNNVYLEHINKYQKRDVFVLYITKEASVNNSISKLSLHTNFKLENIQILVTVRDPDHESALTEDGQHTLSNRVLTFRYASHTFRLVAFTSQPITKSDIFLKHIDGEARGLQKVAMRKWKQFDVSLRMKVYIKERQHFNDFFTFRDPILLPKKILKLNTEQSNSLIAHLSTMTNHSIELSYLQNKYGMFDWERRKNKTELVRISDVIRSEDFNCGICNLQMNSKIRKDDN